MKGQRARCRNVIFCQHHKNNLIRLGFVNKLAISIGNNSITNTASISTALCFKMTMLYNYLSLSLTYMKYAAICRVLYRTDQKLVLGRFYKTTFETSQCNFHMLNAMINRQCNFHKLGMN